MRAKRARSPGAGATLAGSRGALNLVSAATIGATALYMLYRSLGALGVI